MRLGHKSKGKNMVRNLWYGPRTRLVRDIYLPICPFSLARFFFFLQQTQLHEVESCSTANDCGNSANNFFMSFLGFNTKQNFLERVS